ncbi:MAG: AAA family ATPase [Acidimicrobiales bacterium]
MIEHVDLKDWKLHGELAVDFKPGLNFVLGPNGSGKSSLLQAIVFAISGATPTPAPRDAVRMGSMSGASVGVRLNAASGKITITRSIDRGGRVTPVVLTGSRFVRGASASDLAAVLGAEPSELAGLLFLSEGDIYRPNAGDMELDRHLERLLPVQPLQRLVPLAGERRRSLARLLKGQRSELKMSKDQLAELALRRPTLEGELSEMDDRESSLRERENALLEAVRVRDEHRRAVLRFTTWEEQLEGLLASNGLGGVQPSVALEGLEERVRQVERRLRDLIAQRGRYEGERAGVEAATALLVEAETGVCPLCEQPLTQQHRERLIRGQQGRWTELGAHLASTISDLTETERQLSALTAAAIAIRSAIDQRPEGSPPPISAPPELDDELAQVKRDIEDLRSQQRRAVEELTEARTRLAAAEADRRAQDEVIDAFRKDALLQAVENTITSFTSEVRAGVVRPLSQELARQWKRFRPSAQWSLVVGDDGRVAIEMQGETRPYEALSAGEKTVAMVLLRVALAVAFTSAGFVVLDEPLEHLDPRARRVLISSLQYAVQGRLVDQIIVSTYEEALVRRLQHDELAHAIYMD